MDKTGGSAFPRGEIHDEFARPGENVCRHLHAEEGMTLRDYFAAKALSFGFSQNPAKSDGSPDFKWIAQRAYRLADAMLEARNG